MDDARSIAIPDLEEFCTQVFIAQGVAPRAGQAAGLNCRGGGPARPR